MGTIKGIIMGFLKSVLSELKNTYASLASDSVIGDVFKFADTGSYSLNAAISGSIFGGIPCNKILEFQAAEASGKTFYTLATCRSFLESNPNGEIAYFESENALTTDILKQHGIDLNRFAIIPVATVEEFRTQCMKTLQQYEDIKEKERVPFMMCLDSLGMLSTNKEVSDITSGSDTRDMTRSQLIKGAFRVITLKSGRLSVPFIITNHVYQTMELYSKSVGSGGSGSKYAASITIFLSKSKDIDTSTREQFGNIIRAKVVKGRFTRENIVVETQLDYKKGLNRYYGLLDLAIECGVWEKVGNKIKVSDGKLFFSKVINNNPEKFYSQEVLNKIDEWCKNNFTLGHNNPHDDLESDDLEEI